MNTRPLALAATCLSLSLIASRSNAQPRRAAPTATTPDDAEHARGLELRRLHRDGEARDVFREIYQRTREARALAHQASAEAALGDWVLAEEHLTTALENTGDPWITQNRAGLQADLDGFRQHVGLLEVSSSTPRAEVWIGGARVASLPHERPLRVRSGSVTFDVRAEGFISETRTTTVQAGARIPTREVVNLNPVAAPTVAPSPTASGASTAPPASAPVPAAIVAPTPEAEPSWFTPLHIAGLSIASLGLVGVGVGVAGLMIKSGHESTLETAACLNDTMAMRSECNAAADGSDSAQTLAIVGFAAGGALLIGGIVMMIIPGSTPARSSRVSLTRGPGDLGLGLRLAF